MWVLSCETWILFNGSCRWVIISFIVLVHKTSQKNDMRLCKAIFPNLFNSRKNDEIFRVLLIFGYFFYNPWRHAAVYNFWNFALVAMTIFLSPNSIK